MTDKEWMVAALKAIEAQPRLFGGGAGHHAERACLDKCAKIAKAGLTGKSDDAHIQNLISAFSK